MQLVIGIVGGVVGGAVGERPGGRAYGEEDIDFAAALARQTQAAIEGAYAAGETVAIIPAVAGG